MYDLVLRLRLYVPGNPDIDDAIAYAGNADDADEHDGEEHHVDNDFELENEDTENSIPQDLDGWHWAFSETESEEETQGQVDKTCKKAESQGESEPKGKIDEPSSKISRVRVAELREEYIQCQAAGLLIKPAGSTLGVHPGSCTWRASYPGSKHYGRTWGSHRSPKKALLEVIKLVLEDHVNLNKSDKIAKGQLVRVTQAWKES